MKDYFGELEPDIVEPPKTKQNYIGMKFGFWTIIKRVSKRSKFYVCICDCGTEDTRPIYSLKNSISTKCVLCRRKDEKTKPKRSRY